MAKENNRMTLEHSGNHHVAKATFNPKTKKISVGAIRNFSDNAAVMVEVKNGKAKATFVHSGKTHRLQLDANANGTYKAEYKDARFGGIELTVNDGKARLKKGEIPRTGLKIEGKHHKMNLNLGANNKISGNLESKLTGKTSYKINIRDGNVTGGKLVHKGGSHETTLSIDKDKIGLSYTNGKGRAKWGFKIEKNMREAKVFGGLKLSL